MKKKLTALFAASLLFMSATFANTTEPSLQVKTEFNRVFSQSTDVQWKTTANLVIATFQEGGQYLTAFFNPAGKIESVSRNIAVPALPLLLQKGLRDKLADSWISESVEIAGKNGTEYYMTLENADAKIIYKASGGDWIQYQKTKK